MSQSKAELVAPVGIFTASGVNVTGVVTAASFQGDGSQLQGVGIGTTGSVNSSGIITASAFYGSGIGLTGITLLGPTNSYETTGIITAGSFYGDGAGITNINGPLSPITYNPGIGATSVGVTTNITVTFNKPIIAAGATTGVGTITLRTGSADGTIVESFDIVDSSQLSISGGVLTIDPTSNLSSLTTYFVVIPEGTLKDTIDSSDNVGITTYSFTTQQLNYELYAWGDNDYGELGQNNLARYSSPVQVPGTQWRTVTGNYDIVVATKSDGTLWSWGYGGYSGWGAFQPRSSPTQVPGTQWSLNDGGIAVTLNSVNALKTDGTLWVWGQDNFGQLGVNGQTPRSSPVQVPGTEWSFIGTTFYDYHVSALKTDGTLWMWGKNNYGQLGITDKANRSSPTQLPGTQWTSPSGGSSFTAARKTDGTLWVWGYNLYGQLGVNNIAHYSSPVQVPGTQWAANSCGNLIIEATKTDGTLWAWGYGGEGNLGQNDTGHRSSPVQIPGTQWSTEFRGLAGAHRSASALKTDGTLWMWGYNLYGLLGQNSQADRSSPIQVPGTQWYILSRGHVYQMNAIKQVTP